MVVALYFGFAHRDKKPPAVVDNTIVDFLNVYKCMSATDLIIGARIFGKVKKCFHSICW
ncbi:hypothetical protein SAMN04487894_10931 [Niabella drilacis]|uniref:Uncharacterized protein n=1 Tax=Niabella drilacis (strain DSM 25811 / CCM 8410 / CCUG 62505 / LMG 26954 / E90) TaxID=1285928 RepID=A0A1G6UPD7_NIADE|nr:hypothetical protein SAMN04487894_10931 [Niabella drilacis]